MSAVYNITHGLGLAIVTPRWMEFVLDENNAEKSCDNSEYIEKLKRIRINNCFVDAKKECLNTFIKNYTNFINFLLHGTTTNERCK